MKNEAIYTPTKSAVIYARYSSSNQREESIEAQVRACSEYALSLGLNVIEVYADSAKSGTNSDREEFQRMIADSEEGKFGYVIIHKLDRFSRDKYDSVVFKRKLKSNNVNLLSVIERLDGSPESMILESLIEGMAQYYSANLAREVMKGMKESAYKCTHLGGIPPLGYDVDPATKKYVINEAEAKIISKIFNKYADGIGYNQILEYLNGMGHTTKQGKPFSKGSLNTILKNDKYTGRFVFNKKLEKDVMGKRRPKIKPQEEWIVVEDGMPAIIDKETFDKVQLKLAQNLKNGGKFKAKEVYLLTGLIFCGECGSSMYGNTRYCGRGKTKYVSYRCSDRAQHKGCLNKELRKEYLESFVLDELYNKLFSEDSIKKLSTMLTEYNNRQFEVNKDEINTVTTELHTVMDKINKVIRLVSESGISIDTVKDELKQLEERKQFLSAYFNELSLRNKTPLVTETMVTDLINRSKDFVRTKNIAECRNFIENYVERVNVYSEHVEVVFKINLPNEEENDIVPMKSEGKIKVLQTDYKVCCVS